MKYLRTWDRSPENSLKTIAGWGSTLSSGLCLKSNMWGCPGLHTNLDTHGCRTIWRKYCFHTWLCAGGKRLPGGIVLLRIWQAVVSQTPDTQDAGLEHSSTILPSYWDYRLAPPRPAMSWLPTISSFDDSKMKRIVCTGCRTRVCLCACVPVWWLGEVIYVGCFTPYNF